MTNTYTVGQKLNGFTVTGNTELEELNLNLIQLTHDNTGARMVHLQNDDPENMFSVGFRTPPEDSSGVAHILEHTALCGSKNYPVRDPFFSMLKRSLNTFMNAMTASDWTMYPFASQNTKDYYNLMGIYLDAAFFPKLREMDFKQEGHRLEFEEMNNKDSDLQYKGVVYNEMKGAMTDSSSLLGRRLEKALYPTTCYHHNSGGEPSDIPALTWEQLKDFHSTYYHPSNAWFCTYGNLPLEKHLETINELALKQFDKIQPNSEIPLEKRMDTPISVIETYPLDTKEDPDKKTMVQVSWLTCDICDSFETLALSVLESLLLGNPAAPLYKALLDSGLGSNLAPYTGYQEDNRTTFFAAGLQGSNPENTDKIEKLVLDTLNDIADKGFSRERIDGVIHRIELHHKEVTGDSYPYGLLLLMRMFGPWMHNNDPITPLKLNDNLEKLKNELDKGPFFENLIRKHLINNPHRVTLTLKPECGLQEKEDIIVTEKLQKIKASLSDEEKETIIQNSIMLKNNQESTEDLSSLPTLMIEDVPTNELITSWTKEDIADHSVYKFDAPTNGISYFTATFETGGITDKLLPYLPLFCSLLTQVGTEKYNYMEMAERKESGTGGISATAAIFDTSESIDIFNIMVKIKGKALVQNQDKLFSILKDMCLTPDFTDKNRLYTVIGQIKISLENSISNSGHSYAMRSATSKLTPAGYVKEIWSGLTQVQLIKKIANINEEDLDEISTIMTQIANIIFSNQFTCAMTTNSDSMEKMIKEVTPFIKNFNSGSKESTLNLPDFTKSSDSIGWAISTPVSYVTRAFRTTNYLHEDSAPLTILSKIMRAGYLHREIREKGGAYGGMCSYSPKGGIFSLLSYRDPHLARTINVYTDAINWASAGKFTDEDIKEAILSVFSDIDKPLSPSGKGMIEYSYILQDLTPEIRKQFRKNLLAVTKDQLISVTNTYLKDKFDESVVSVVSNEELLKAANKELSELKMTIKRV